MNQLQTFSYQGFAIEFEVIDGEVYANATAMCKPFGKTTYEWSRLPQTIRYAEGLKSKLNANRENPVSLSISRKGGMDGGCTLIHEKLILKLAQWLDVDFEIWCDERVSEVIKGTKQPTLPQTYKEALQALLVEVEQKEQLLAENEALRPKAAYAEAVLSSTTELTTTVIAQELGMSAVRLNKELHMAGVQYKQRGTWVLYSVHVNKGYANLKTHPYTDSSGKAQTKHYLVWTETGREFIHRILNRKLIQSTSLTALRLGSPTAQA